MKNRRKKSRRLLVMACSSRKSASPGLLPAIERYDGVAYRVVKRLLRIREFPADVDVMILSAKYGLIRDDNPIQHYDLRMTPAVAQRQAARNRTVLRKVMEVRKYRETFISAGKVYLLALEPFGAWQRSTPVTINKGKIGIQLKRLKDWLLTRID